MASDYILINSGLRNIGTTVLKRFYEKQGKITWQNASITKGKKILATTDPGPDWFSDPSHNPTICSPDPAEKIHNRTTAGSDSDDRKKNRNDKETR